MSDPASPLDDALAGSRLLLGLLLAVAVIAPLEVSAQDSVQNTFRPLTQAMLNDPDPSDWLMWRGGYANWGYSPLDQITADNVNELRLAWSWAFAPAGPGSTGMDDDVGLFRVDPHGARLAGDLALDRSEDVEGYVQAVHGHLRWHMRLASLPKRTV